ncbi:hypothetical protein GTA08_BOTSDO00413 [Botryosphaeria dothidea]|uniref:Integrase catalytic domain-containing protein n=1 Tax=Botryosphaeria dothidea TaxID=55169 RepID=A0A8H4N7I2_9PEZI|nr:hypothetical protein GTA08_BOTSDO00413 [Botryosphaeria dothidea]
MRTKSAAEVAKNFRRWAAAFGPSDIYQSDRGSEFKEALKLLLQQLGIKQVLSRPRHPRTNGLIEQNNAQVKQKLMSIARTIGERDLAFACAEVAMQLNATPKRALKGKTPYFIVFGRQMNSHPVSPALREDLEINKVLDDEWQDAEGVSPADLPYPGGNSRPISSRDSDLSPPMNRDDPADDDNVVFLHKSTCPATKISTLDPHDDKDKAPTLPSVSGALFNEPNHPVLNDESLRSYVIERVAKINIRQGGLKELHKEGILVNPRVRYKLDDGSEEPPELRDAMIKLDLLAAGWRGAELVAAKRWLVREYKPAEDAVGGPSNTAEEAEEESITAKTTELASATLALAGSTPRQVRFSDLNERVTPATQSELSESPHKGRQCDEQQINLHDQVTFPVPAQDRRGNIRRYFGKVINNRNGYYEIQTKYGIINHLFPPNELVLVHATHHLPENVFRGRTNKISVVYVAKMEHGHINEPEARFCTSKCHTSHSYTNKYSEEDEDDKDDEDGEDILEEATGVPSRRALGLD